MKKVRRYFAGNEVDEMEAANKRTERTLTNPNAKEYGEAGTSEMVEATPQKAAAKSKAAAKPAPKAAAKEAPVDVTKLSVAERRKLSRENPSVSGPTDTRSVNQRLRAAFGFSKGGSVGSASKRADGIAQRGKTRGTMC